MSTIEKILKDTRLVVKATSFEVYSLWKDNRDNEVKAYSWEQEPAIEFSFEVADSVGPSSNLRLQPELIEGKRILFWENLADPSSTASVKKFFNHTLPNVEQTDVWGFWNKFRGLK